jgi:hypothetical protein
LTLGAIVAVSTPAPATAVNLDTPNAAFLDNSPSYISLMVTAGASGAPHGFTVEWMPKADFDAWGWPTDYTPPGFNYCTFDGVPSFNLTPGVADFLLGSSEGAEVVLGELFDETGLYTTYVDELEPQSEYAVRVRAEGGPGGGASANSATLILSSGPHEICRFTQGYWKNHPSAWPPSALPMLLGTVAYSQAQLLAILGQPALGNGLLILGHQLIAAKLNVVLAAAPPSIVAAIAAADAMIGALVIPPIGSDTLPSSTVSALATQLDDFNNGKTDGDNCLTPVNASSWGRLKALYR